jgi:hypothetical protein
MSKLTFSEAAQRRLAEKTIQWRTKLLHLQEDMRRHKLKLVDMAAGDQNDHGKMVAVVSEDNVCRGFFFSAAGVATNLAAAAAIVAASAYYNAGSSATAVGLQEGATPEGTPAPAPAVDPSFFDRASSDQFKVNISDVSLIEPEVHLVEEAAAELAPEPIKFQWYEEPVVEVAPEPVIETIVEPVVEVVEEPAISRESELELERFSEDVSAVAEPLEALPPTFETAVWNAMWSIFEPSTPQSETQETETQEEAVAEPVESLPPTFETAVWNSIWSFLEPSAESQSEKQETETQEEAQTAEPIGDLPPTLETAVWNSMWSMFEPSESQEEQEVVEDEIPVIKTPSVETMVWDNIYSLLQWNYLVEDPEEKDVEKESAAPESTPEEPATVETAQVDNFWKYFLPLSF